MRAKSLLIVSAILIALSGLGLLWPLASGLTYSVSPPNDPGVIRRYAATYRVAADGRLIATERLTVDLPSGRHGIFWYFPVADPSDSHLRIVPAVTGITMNGREVPVEYSWRNGRSVYVARIGDSSTTLAQGTYLYEIGYTIDGVLAKTPSAQGKFPTRAGENRIAADSSFYWNAVGFWEMPIRTAQSVIELPVQSGLVQCAASTGGSIPCAIEGAGTERVAITAENLAPRNPVTVRVDLPMTLPARTTLPWPVRFDGILGRSTRAAGAVAVLTLLAALAGSLWVRRSRETPPGLPVTYVPPDGLGPAQTVYIVKETVGEHALVATLLHMAERKLVELERIGAKKWALTGTATSAEWANVDPVTRGVGEALGITEPGRRVVTGGKRAGEKLANAAQTAKSSTRSWAQTEGLSRYEAMVIIGRVLVFICILVAVVRFWGYPTMWGLPFAVFAIAGVWLFATGAGTRRTAAGRRLWSRAGGFERLLSTPSSEDRFDFAARKDLFMAYIPYAVAFGVADTWAAKYRTATGQEPPEVPWYPGTRAGGAAGLYSGTALAGLGAAIATSISAYQASQSSSSSSGGFSSGGGGFGGGGGSGGGSW